MKTQYISVRSIIDDVNSFCSSPLLSEIDILRTSNDIVRSINTDDQYEHRVYWSEVEDYTVELPKDQKILLQVCYRGNNKEAHKGKIELTEWSKQAMDGCEYRITKLCPQCKKEECNCKGSYVTIDIDDIWRQQHPEYQYMHMDWMYRWGGMNKSNIPVSNINSEFQIIRYSQHYFHNVDFHIKGCTNLDHKMLSHCDIEYSITGNILRVNRPHGEILISYLGIITDSEGHIMIPDIQEVIDLIKWKCEELVSYREYKKSKNNSDFILYNNAKNEILKLRRAIHSKLNTPSYNAWISFLENHWKRMIPTNRRYANHNKFSPDLYQDSLTKLSYK